MKLKTVFLSVILAAVCSFSSCAEEKLPPLEERNSPPVLKIYDPTTAQPDISEIAAAGFSWNFSDKTGEIQSVIADAVHPLDENAVLVKVSFYYEYPTFEFDENFEPNNIRLQGWDISQKGDTSDETVYAPKTDFSQNFTSGDYTGLLGTALEKDMIYQFTVTYDKTPYLEELGFYGTADYYFET